MRVDKNLTDLWARKGLGLTIDFSELRLCFFGDEACTVDETFPSLEAMDAVFRERIGPYLASRTIHDVDENQPLEPIEDLASFREEIAARATGEPVPVGADPLDEMVVWFTNLLRDRLNKALGPAPRTLHVAGFAMHDAGLVGVTLDMPAAVAKSREEIEAAIAADPFGWSEGDFRRTAAYSLELEPGFAPLAEFSDPRSLVADGPQRLFYLACARLERDPRLRSNVAIGNPLRVFWFNYDETGIAWDWRETAAAHVDGPARAYFEQTCERSQR